MTWIVGTAGAVQGFFVVFVACCVVSYFSSLITCSSHVLTNLETTNSDFSSVTVIFVEIFWAFSLKIGIFKIYCEKKILDS